ncbi:MAG: AbrB/MazE/SpoVT family DNA-binding domain-containing protein [Oscillospiraceae bacterium]
MRATGIVRKMDDLGRIVIPMEIRRTMNISEGQPLEIFVEESGIVLRRFETACVICGCNEAEKLKKYNNKAVCKDCIKKITEKEA